MAADSVIEGASAGQRAAAARPVAQPLARPIGKPVWGILFAEDFDAKAPPVMAEPEPEEPEVIEPMFSLAELEAARAGAREEGISAGLAQAEEAHRQAVRVALQTLAEQLTDARAQACEAVQVTAEAMARTLLATLCAALPALCAHHGAAELRHVLQAVLPSLTHEPRVSVQVNPRLVEAMTNEIASLGHAFAAIVTLTSSEELLPGDIRIAWQHGGASRDTHAILGEIDQALGAIGLREALPPRSAARRPDRPGRKEGLSNVG